MPNEVQRLDASASIGNDVGYFSIDWSGYGYTANMTIPNGMTLALADLNTQLEAVFGSGNCVANESEGTGLFAITWSSSLANTNIPEGTIQGGDFTLPTISTTTNGGPDATVPGAPVLSLDSVGDEQITLSWTEPASNGSAITQYRLYLDGVTETDNVTSPLTITGLTNGVEAGAYTVSATNGVGEGDQSNAVSGTPVDSGPDDNEAAILLLF